VLIGFLPFPHALNTRQPEEAHRVHQAAQELKKLLADQQEKHFSLFQDLDMLESRLQSLHSLDAIQKEERWEVRQAIFRTTQYLKKNEAVQPFKSRWEPLREELLRAIEYVPLWVVIGTALALGIGTTIGYQRIVITVAEKIGKSHLTYAQGACAELVAALTILLATITKAPVSTTQVLSSGVAGTMVANKSGVQSGTIRKIALAWLFTLPATMLLSGLFYVMGRWFLNLA
ncbi:MAG TPA: inorganic phosphate transporter, partial [Gemmatales bacterium]|nr:inorganic phosphate transporter [Gemmatales bacterium]